MDRTVELEIKIQSIYQAIEKTEKQIKFTQTIAPLDFMHKINHVIEDNVQLHHFFSTLISEKKQSHFQFQQSVESHLTKALNDSSDISEDSHDLLVFTSK